MPNLNDFKGYWVSGRDSYEFLVGAPSPVNDGGMDLPVDTVTPPYGHSMILVAYSVSGDTRWRINLS